MGTGDNNSLLKVIASIVLGVFFLCVLTWQIIDNFSTYNGLIIRYANYFTFWLGGISLVAVFLFWYLSMRLLASMTLLLALFILYPYMLLYMPNEKKPAHEEKIFDVMTYSVMTRNEESKAIMSVISENPADIIFLQEVSAKNREYIIKSLSTIYQGERAYMKTRNSFVTISRYPLKKLPLEKELGGIAIRQLEVDVHGKNIQVWNLHFVKPFANLKWHKSTVTKLLASSDKVKGPLLIVGDFNFTERSNEYKQMIEKFTNAHAESGYGLGFTFPAPARRAGLLGPFLRIDHIFHNSFFQSLDAQVVNNAGGSDHFPIRATLTLK